MKSEKASRTRIRALEAATPDAARHGDKHNYYRRILGVVTRKKLGGAARGIVV
jgi:hypothetical protein